MTPTEKLYAQCIGKLYLLPLDEWKVRQYTRLNKTVPQATLLMPYRMAKHGGWWFFTCQLLSNRNIFHSPDEEKFGCKEFLKKGLLYHAQPPESIEKFLLGNTPA